MTNRDDAKPQDKPVELVEGELEAAQGAGDQDTSWIKSFSFSTAITRPISNTTSDTDTLAGNYQFKVEIEG